MDFALQTGIGDMLLGATFTVKVVLGLLAFMSMISWYIIFYKLFSLGRARKRAIKDGQLFKREANLEAAMHSLKLRPISPVFNIAKEGMQEIELLEKAAIHASLKFRVAGDNLNRILEQEVNNQVEILSRSLPFLATCANAAPFIGLFGTVWGIMHSFHSIGLQKTAALAAVAPGISEALVATAIGLGVAIPATMAYNSFLGTLNSIRNELENFAVTFINQAQRELPWMSAQKFKEQG